MRGCEYGWRACKLEPSDSGCRGICCCCAGHEYRSRKNKQLDQKTARQRAVKKKKGKRVCERANVRLLHKGGEGVTRTFLLLLWFIRFHMARSSKIFELFLSARHRCFNKVFAVHTKVLHRGASQQLVYLWSIDIHQCWYNCCCCIPAFIEHWSTNLLHCQTSILTTYSSKNSKKKGACLRCV